MRKVTLGTTIAYGMPGLGAGYMYLLMSLYVMKFSTDVLLIAPAVMGVIFSISRIWDAVSDPIAGYLSDRTTFKFGRRRTWMLLSFIPISFGFLAVFSPPESMQGQSLDLWMFGVRHIGFTLGSILALVSMSLLISEENNPDGDVRQLAGSLAFYAIGAMSLMIFFAVSKLKENPEFQNRVNKNPFKAFRDVWINPHAKILIIVLFIENLGGAVIGVLTLYVTQYIVEAPAWAPLIIFAYMLPSALSVPLWIPLSRRFGKIRLWVFSLAFTGISFGGIFIIPFLDSITDRLIVMFIGAALGGMAAGCGGAIGPSVKGDVIDYDEYLTGERKEGSYFAALNFVFKSATGIMLLVTGFVLQFSGFIPNQPQTMEVKIALISLYGLVPLVFYSLGAYLLYKKFKFGEKEHAAIKQQIQERA